MNNSTKTITVCAVDCIVPQLASNALEKCKSRFLAEKFILLTDQNIEGDHDLIKINKLDSIASYNKFMLTELWKYIETDFVLIIQWDGYIVDPKSWRNDFLDYDYIGALWPQYDDAYKIGNGGFSLRSKKLLLALLSPEFVNDDNENEDTLICRLNRKYLEDHKEIKFPDEDMANYFSYEQTLPRHQTFGFHGLWNMWRHEDDETLVEILDLLPRYYFKGYLIDKTIMNLFLQGRKKSFYKAFEKVSAENDLEHVKNVLVHALKFEETDVRNMIKCGILNSRMEYIFTKVRGLLSWF